MSEPPAGRVFLLSPASTSGKRARLLSRRVWGDEGEPIGEIFSFLSALYFRGKLAYAREFASPASAIRIITSDRGLVAPEHRLTLADLRSMARGSIDLARRRYRAPLTRDVELLAAELDNAAEVVLLGSIATDKYAAILLEAFGSRLVFPEAFVGRGDMSRGGLLLRAVRENRELEYRPLVGAVRRGSRPPRLIPLARSAG